MLKVALLSIFICFWIFLIGTGCQNISTKKTANEQSVIKNTGITTVKMNKLYHDFGDVREGETLGCYFVVTNSGDSPLVIHNIDCGCNCMRAVYLKKPVLPGDSTEVEIRFNSTGFYGKQYKSVQLSANIRDKVKELVIAANVIN